MFRSRMLWSMSSEKVLLADHGGVGFEREDLAFLMEMIDMRHSVATGGNSQGFVLNSGEFAPVSFRDDRRPDRAGVLQCATTDALVRHNHGFLVLSPVRPG